MLETVANFLQTMTLVLSMSAFVPQWMLLLKERDSSSCSMRAWTIWSLSSLFSSFYAVVQFSLHSYGFALVCTSVCALICNIVTLGLIFRFRGKEVARRESPEDIIAPLRLAVEEQQEVAELLKLTAYPAKMHVTNQCDFFIAGDAA